VSVSALADAVAADDRHPVPGNEDVGVTGRHVAQRGRPFRRVALDLLGVARVRCDPEEEIAREDDAAVGPPDPGGVVGLAAGVVQVQHGAAHLEAQRLVVREIRVVVLGRPGGWDGELSCVDDGVVAVGETVAVESCGDGPVSDDAWPRPPAIRCLGREQAKPTGVIDVAMRVHRRGERIPIDGADRREGLVARRLRARVDEHEAGLRS
jgi:hypothetical protein